MNYSYDWWALALCRQSDPEIWFTTIVEAKSICKLCEVKEECLEDALSTKVEKDRHGIRGGYTPKERRDLRKSRQVNNSVVH